MQLKPEFIYIIPYVIHVPPFTVTSGSCPVEAGTHAS